MKHLKTFEERHHFLDVYIKDYGFITPLSMQVKALKEDLNDLERFNISHKLLYHIEKGDIFFKNIIEKMDIKDIEKLKILKYHRMENYTTSWEWIEIDKEDIELVIQTNKYNL